MHYALCIKKGFPFLPCIQWFNIAFRFQLLAFSFLLRRLAIVRVYSCQFVVNEKESRVCFIVFAGGLSIMLFEKEPDVLRSGDAAEQG